jgi:uncharacterized protein involved in copper resistance
VWFQNARAKYRRNVLKDTGGEKQGARGRDSRSMHADSPSQDSQNTVLELSREGSSPPLTDMSSTPSLPPDYGASDHGEMDRGAMDHGAMDRGVMDQRVMDHGAMDQRAMEHVGVERSPQMSSLSELFNTSINHMT